MKMRAEVLNGLLLVLLATGIAAWIAPVLDAGHGAAAIALLFIVVRHANTATKDTGRDGRGWIAAAAVLIVALLGLGSSTGLVLAHVAGALMLVGAAVMVHVRALGRLSDLVDAVALTLSIWLVLRLYTLF